MIKYQLHYFNLIDSFPIIIINNNNSKMGARPSNSNDREYYRHYKGGIYQREFDRPVYMHDTNTPLIIYRNVKTDRCYARSENEFFGMVSHRKCVAGPGTSGCALVVVDERRFALIPPATEWAPCHML
jgi:hypothetical protein